MSLSFLPVLQSPDGRYIASGAFDGIVNIFDIQTGKLLHTLEGKILLKMLKKIIRFNQVIKLDIIYSDEHTYCSDDKLT